MAALGDNISWLGHSSFLITTADGKHIYLDPWKTETGLPAADLICITHEHYDHCSKKDVDRLATRQTPIVTTHAAADELGRGSVQFVKPGDRLTAAGVAIEVVPAYNVDKEFHPKEDGRVGFILTLDGTRIYHAGDTDYIPEMETIKADVALLPVSGTYVMTAEEAARAAAAIKPALAIPMHYGSIVGTHADARRFTELASVPVRVLERGGR